MLAEAAAIMSRREAPRYAFLLRINTSDPLRLWTGVGDLETDPSDDLDPSQVYSGIGILTGLPAIRQLVGGIAEQLNITMSGVDAIPQNYVDDEDRDIVGSEINIGIVFFDDDWQQAAPCGNRDGNRNGSAGGGTRRGNGARYLGRHGPSIPPGHLKPP